jgi:predicted ATPase/DNA-binding CsgD family transcriptional regulator
MPSRPPKSLSSFVGRRREIENLTEALLRTRLLTLTGPGGCGKSRLAIEVAGTTADRLRARVAFTDLAPVHDPAMVRESIASSLGPFRQATLETMAGIVGSAGLLLLIDNAEHLLEPVSLVADGLLANCPDLRIVVTSRTPLNMGGETNWVVPPLELPPPDVRSDPARVAAYDAVELFLVRVAEHQPDFELTAETEDMVVTVCRRLDGIPLALELAAARMRSMGLAEIVKRLDDSLVLLTGGARTAMARHQTMHAAVDWSHRWLDGRARALFRRMAVFVGTFDLEAVEAVCTGPDQDSKEVADALRQLIDSSLVTTRPRPAGGLRYGLIEVIRQYGQERLDEAGESWVLARHAAHYAAFVCGMAVGGMDGLKDRPSQLSMEYENVRVALDWAAKNDPEMEAAMVDGLLWYWRLRGSMREARARIQSALEKEPSVLPIRARLLADAAHWAQWAGDLRTALVQIEEAVRLLDQIDDVDLACGILQFRAIVRCRDGNLVAAEEDQRRAVELLSAVTSRTTYAITLNNLAFIHLLAGRPGEALDLTEKAMRIGMSPPNVELPSVDGRAPVRMDHDPVMYHAPLASLHARGAAFLAQGRAQEAWGCFLSGLELVVEHDNHALASGVLKGLGCVAAALGNLHRCLEFLAAAERCIEMVGGAHTFALMPLAEAERASRLAAQDLEDAEATWQRGLKIDLRQALQIARAESWGSAELPLTPRKREIVRLVAQGLSDKEIARRMAISVRTVEAHLEQLRHHLGFHNRAQLAVWAASNGLWSAPPPARG